MIPRLKFALPSLLLTFAQGCALLQPYGPQTIDNLKLDTAMAVNGAIVFSDNNGAEARRIFNVASTVKQIAQDSTLDISDLEALAVQIAMKQSPGKDRDKAVFVTNLFFYGLRKYTAIGDAQIIPPEKLQQAREVLLAVSEAAIEAARPYLETQT